MDLCGERGLEIGAGPHGGTEGKLPYEVHVCQQVTTVHMSRHGAKHVEKACKACVIKACCTTSTDNLKFQDDNQMQWVKAR